ncbi:hypothetical protein [Streptomyces sp. NPDC048272]|uniref:hypothetical protein n=1 Tax=Streptomyces sp. NPDC048272 TaxID=3154616 RepID=UPI00344AF607
MTSAVTRSHTVTARIETPDSTPAPARSAGNTAPAISRDKYQLGTLHELAAIIEGRGRLQPDRVNRIQDGVQHATVETPAPAAHRTRPTWNGTDAPF